MPRHRYALRLLYDGGAFRGYQRQPGLPTVQAAVCDALSSLGIPAPLAAAARTDAGVHALAQVVGFSTRTEIDTSWLRAELNARLPPALVCLEARRVPASFHARASARSRRYVYLVGSPPPPGLEPYCWCLPDPRAFPGVEGSRLDVAAMRDALGRAVGRHDFRGFARPGGPGGTIREITRVAVLPAEWHPLVLVELEGTGFLRAMARNLVGTAVTVGLGLADPGCVSAALEHPGRYRGVRAPAWGLTLAAVDYPPEAWPR